MSEKASHQWESGKKKSWQVPPKPQHSQLPINNALENKQISKSFCRCRGTRQRQSVSQSTCDTRQRQGYQTSLIPWLNEYLLRLYQWQLWSHFNPPASWIKHYQVIQSSDYQHPSNTGVCFFRCSLDSLSTSPNPTISPSEWLLATSPRVPWAASSLVAANKQT